MRGESGFGGNIHTEIRHGGQLEESRAGDEPSLVHAVKTAWDDGELEAAWWEAMESKARGRRWKWLHPEPELERGSSWACGAEGSEKNPVLVRLGSHCSSLAVPEIMILGICSRILVWD